MEDKIDAYKPNKQGTPINAYDANGKLCLTFANGVEASKYFGITPTAISAYVTHKNGYVCCNGYYLAKEGEQPIIRDNLLTSYGRDGVIVY